MEVVIGPFLAGVIGVAVGVGHWHVVDAVPLAPHEAGGEVEFLHDRVGHSAAGRATEG